MIAAAALARPQSVTHDFPQIIHSFLVEPVAREGRFSIPLFGSPAPDKTAVFGAPNSYPFSDTPIPVLIVPRTYRLSYLSVVSATPSLGQAAGKRRKLQSTNVAEFPWLDQS